MEFSELVNQYPYLEECNIDKALPKVLVVTKIYNKDDTLITSFNTNYTLPALLNFPNILEDIGCTANNEYQLAEFLNNVLGPDEIRSSLDITDGYATYIFERWI